MVRCYYFFTRSYNACLLCLSPDLVAPLPASNTFPSPSLQPLTYGGRLQSIQGHVRSHVYKGDGYSPHCSVLLNEWGPTAALLT